ncbi:MAG: hypothetical protein ACRDF5_10105, partial [bacterium]
GSPPRAPGAFHRGGGRERPGPSPAAGVDAGGGIVMIRRSLPLRTVLFYLLFYIVFFLLLVFVASFGLIAEA